MGCKWKKIGTMLACVAAFGPSAFANDAGHLSVSSDGVMESSPAAVAKGVSGFRGQRTPGERRDAQAESPAAFHSAQEMAAMANTFRPMVPPYARRIQAAQSVIGGPESVIGGIDSRYRIKPFHSGHPEQAIGLLKFKQAGEGGTCTGWLINANTVVTAGHCVHQGAGGSFHTEIKFIPGRDGANSPFGSCTAKDLYTSAGWAMNGDPEFDYGAVKLKCRIGNTTGALGFFWQEGSLAGLPVQVSGYPGDKPFATQWSTSGAIAVSEVRTTFYKHDSAFGMSGGPVFETDREGEGCTGPCVNSIHTYGDMGGGFNSGTRITQEVFNNLVNWMNAR